MIHTYIASLFQYGVNTGMIEQGDKIMQGPEEKSSGPWLYLDNSSLSETSEEPVA